MENQNKSARLLPYLLAVVAFLAVTTVYFSPVLEGKVLGQHDVTQYEGMRADISSHARAFGEDPQWTGGMFGGMPSYLISVDYDSMILRAASSWLNGLAMPISLIVVAMLSFFLMTLLCGMGPREGTVGALAYGLSTYFFLIIGAGHITKVVAMAYAPLLFGGVWYTLRRDMWLGAAVTALAGAVEIAAGHPQITYYFGMVIAAFWINELVQAVKGRTLPRLAAATGLLAVAAVLAVGANFISLYNVQEHSKYTIRGGSELTRAEKANDRGLDIDYATAWSYGRGETLNLLVPDLMGGSSMGGFSPDGEVADALVKYGARNQAAYLPAYWGDQPITGGPTYLGAVALLLACAGMFLLGGREKWWLLAVSVLAVMLSWGHNFMWLTELFFKYLPGYDKFRTVSMILCIVEWSVPMLAVMFLYKATRKDTDPVAVVKASLRALYAVGGLSLFLLMFGGAIFSFTSPMDSQMPADIAAAMRTERASMLRGDALRSLIFALLTFGVIWVMAKGKLKTAWAFVALAALVCADLIPVNARFLPQSSFHEKRSVEVRPTDADLQIMSDTTPGFRVANLTVSTFNDATTSMFHRSVGGYHGAKLQRYQDLIDRYLSRGDREIYNMLNTRYYIVSEGQGAPPEAAYNPDANGAAWFVEQTVPAATPDEQIEKLGRIDTKTQAVVEDAFAGKAAAASMAAAPGDTVYLADYRVNRLTYKYRAAGPRLAVFSEIYYPEGWSATVDGQPLDYFRADYLLRAAVLPAGEGEVVFRFAIPHFALLQGITLACSLLILLFLAAALIVKNFICKKNVKRPQ